MRGVAAVLTVTVLSACGTVSGTYPRTGAVVPNASLQLTRSIAIPAEKVVTGAVGAALLYVIYDPLAPNWNIQEQQLGEDTYYVSMRAKRFRIGGDGEAVMILKRRAGQLQREKGYASYRIVDFSQGIESSTPIAQLYSEATIQLARAETPPKQP